MATNTVNYGLVLQDRSDNISIAAINDNMEKIDRELKEANDKIPPKFIPLVSGDDLNTITAQNRYRSPSGTVTKAMANVPEVVGNNGFSLDVYTTASYPFYVQEITWCGYSTFLVNKIVRCGRTVDGALQWGEWYQHKLEAVVEATE